MLVTLPKTKSHILFSQSSCLSNLINFLHSHKKYTKAFVLSDKIVYSLHGNSLIEALNQLPLDSFSFQIDSGESFKTLDTASLIFQKMHAEKLDRASVVIALGGGVITDLAGFIASCYMRGIDVIHVPTSLMAMVDASIGGKTAVNLASGKNMIGTFHQPTLSYISPSFLSTLPEKEFAAGLAECVKCAIIQDDKLFNFLEVNAENILKKDKNILHHLIEQTIKIKAQIVENDEKDKGVRNHLNLGHTFAHALESLTNYKTYLHGEAVSIGIKAALTLSVMLNLCDETVLNRVKNLLKKFNLPLSIPTTLNISQLIELMYGDKKATDKKLNLILVKKIGEVQTVFDINPLTISKCLGK